MCLGSKNKGAAKKLCILSAFCVCLIVSLPLSLPKSLPLCPSSCGCEDGECFPPPAKKLLQESQTYLFPNQSLHIRISLTKDHHDNDVGMGPIACNISHFHFLKTFAFKWLSLLMVFCRRKKPTVIKTVELVLLPNTSLSFSKDLCLQTIFTYKGHFQKKKTGLW